MSKFQWVDSSSITVNYEKPYSPFKDLERFGEMDPYITEWCFSSADTGSKRIIVQYFTMDSEVNVDEVIDLLNARTLRPLQFVELVQLAGQWPQRLMRHRIVAFGSSRPCFLIGGDWAPFLYWNGYQHVFDLRWFGHVQPDGWLIAAVRKEPKKSTEAPAKSKSPKSKSRKR